MRKTILVAVLSGLVGALVAVPVAVYASHSFNDVPETNTFHADIEWLKDSGVTKGCNPPANTDYCPDDPVTREQMAAFMHRLAINEVVDAGSLEGRTVDDLAPRAAFNWTEDAPDGEDLTLGADIEAPAPGILVFSGGVEASGVTETDPYVCEIAVDDIRARGTFRRSTIDAGDPPSDNRDEDCATTSAVAVDAGTYRVDLRVRSVAATTELSNASMWAMWIPLDGMGATPTP